MRSFITLYSISTVLVNYYKIKKKKPVSRSHQITNTVPLVHLCLGDYIDETEIKIDK